MNSFVLLVALFGLSNAFFFPQSGGCGCPPPPPPPVCNCAPPPLPPCGGAPTGCGGGYALPPPPPAPIVNPVPAIAYNQPPQVPVAPIYNQVAPVENNINAANVGVPYAQVPPQPEVLSSQVQVAPATVQQAYINPAQPVVAPAPVQGGYVTGVGRA
ncbi:hypothetical protein QR680_004416 [Steinernema hermaphroditum]|uniref:VM domain-containing protein n=1 Tax=Steinernema hermaphroditum TaxID=289476 RepID=A0AA39HNM0_9BILA|nr:hypothetical protein QR680_004416 [Steinernema hermaphroditum]